MVSATPERTDAFLLGKMPPVEKIERQLSCASIWRLFILAQ